MPVKFGGNHTRYIEYLDVFSRMCMHESLKNGELYPSSQLSQATDGAEASVLMVALVAILAKMLVQALHKRVNFLSHLLWRAMTNIVEFGDFGAVCFIET